MWRTEGAAQRDHPAGLGLVRLAAEAVSQDPRPRWAGVHRHPAAALVVGKQAAVPQLANREEAVQLAEDRSRIALPLRPEPAM
jgi:hypothetical protein